MKLSGREEGVLRTQIYYACNLKQAAEKMGIDYRRACDLRLAAFRKIGVTNEIELTKWAKNNGWW